MKKNISEKVLKKIVGVGMSLAIAVSGLQIADSVNYTKQALVFADETSDFSVKVQTNPDDQGYIQERIGQMIFTEMYITGGASGKQYKYEIKNLKTGAMEKTTEYKDCSDDWEMFGIVFSSVGERELIVYVKDGEGKVTKSAPYKMDIIEGSLDAGIFLDDEISVRGYDVGDEIELAIVAAGGNGDYTYKYEMRNSDTGKVTVLKDFCKDDKIKVELKESGDVIAVYGIVKDSSGNECETNSVSIKVTGNAVNNKLPENTNLKGVFSISGSTAYLECNVGELNLSSIMVNDEFNEYEYKYEIIDIATGIVEKSCEYSIGNAFGIIINSSGEKLVKGYVKDVNGNETETNAVTVKVKETSLSATLSVSHNGSTLPSEYVIGDEILLYVSAMGGSGDYTYKYETIDNKTGEKIILKEFCADPAYTEILKEDGKKEYVVSVKDSSGNTIETNYVKIDVNGNVEVNSENNNKNNNENNNEGLYSFVKFWIGNVINTIKFILNSFENIF